MSSGPPNLGPSNLENTTKLEMKVEKTEQIGQEEDDPKLYFSQFVGKWGVLRRKLRKAFLVLMSKEMRVSMNIATTNALFKEQILQMMEGHVTYFTRITQETKKGKDKLSKELRKKNKKARASALVFERLVARIKEEMERLNDDSLLMMDYIEEDLKKHQDTRMEPRACFWTLFLSGLMLHNIDRRVEDEFEILMKVSLDYDNVYKHTLVTFLHFVYYLIKEIPPFPEEDAQTNLVINVKRTGYSMAHWIKYRYGTSSQQYMEYERYISYYARSFGLIRGKAPQYKRDAFFGWMDRTFNALEKTLLSSDVLISIAKGQTIEGVIAGLIDQMELALDKRKYDEEGNLLNQPEGGEGALRFLQWLLETAFHRKRTPNIAIQKDIRMDLGMFEFLPHTISWVNALGEKLTVDWLGIDEEDEGE